MGCSSSKRIEVDVYRPAPASFAVFDINAIQEPWLMVENTQEQQQDEKQAHVPAPILEKLNKFELAPDAPHSWDEPTLQNNPIAPAAAADKPQKPEPIHPPAEDITPPETKPPSKSHSFHTLDELDAKLSSPKPTELTQLKKSDSTRAVELKKPVFKKTEVKKTELKKEEPQVGVVGEGVVKPVRENIFILKDRLEREREGKEARFEKLRRDPLSDYPEKCPPGGADSVVLYTTSLHGVRRTYEDCNRARSIMEFHRVVFDERDVSLHGEFLKELKELLGEGAAVPRLFVKGRYIGGVEEVVDLNESGRLGRMMNYARVERGVGRQACEGCGGARFVPCLECGGSCKVLVGDKKERCSKCNENGLVHCPACL
ncbi:hypothetical protein L1049_021849 [Liquidambar formosana]|uniref:Glutaredoxin domain-containing protein n=1 Tax=Liquidambar formosana TaxID=63359 RepID=A0AAP0WQ76_LIQFO